MKEATRKDSAVKPMTIKDVSERTGISVYTLRYYAREGLLPSVERDKNGVRYFTETDLESVYIIECLKNCDMSIQEIKDFTRWTMEGDSTIDQRLALFQDKYNVLQEKMWKMQETVDDLRKGYKSTKTTPLGRSGKLTEVADTVMFLASDRASYIHGVTYNIAGGKTRG